MKLVQELGSEDLVFFLHIPKTAGTTLRMALDRCFDTQDILPSCLQERFIQYTPEDIKPYKFIRGHFKYPLLMNKVHNRPFLITIVRDPVEQYISFFEQWKRKTKELRENQESLKNEIKYFEQTDLEAFLQKPSPIIEKVFINNQTRHLAQKVGMKYSRERFIYDPEVLENAKNLISDMTCIGSVERLQESYYLISYFLSIPPIVDQTRLNAAPERPEQKSISKESLDQIGEYVKMDLEIYNMAHSLISERLEQMYAELIEKYGDDTTKLPLTHGQVIDLLQKHYEKSYHKKHALIPEIEFKIAKAVYHENWFRSESNPRFGEFRWTGPGVTSRLDLPVQIDNSPMQITIHAIRTLKPELMDTVKLHVFKKRVPLTTTLTNGIFKLEGVYEPEAFDKERSFITLEITLEETVWTKEKDRKVGIAISQVDVKPILIPARNLH